MGSLLNKNRPPVFCPGCAHDKVLHAVDTALSDMGCRGRDVVLVTDIGCSGLFDVFFNTHAFHGLHGRALTYATGIKMAQPDLTVIVTMGDGGLGIGAAHVLSTCRRNIDLTLLVLNNFNYGMTGGQCSSTTPRDARVSSGFLNQLEPPMDICQVAGAAGAPFVARISTYDKGLVPCLKMAIGYDGFSLVDIWGICPGRYTRGNKVTPASIEADMAGLPPVDRFQELNARTEYGRAYRQAADSLALVADPVPIEATCTPPPGQRQEIVLLGGAGQRIVTAGELLCQAGAAAGWHATQKNDYPITVMRGHSVSELILSDTGIDYTGIEKPSVVIALADEGVQRKEKMFSGLDTKCLVIRSAGVDVPPGPATVVTVDFSGMGIKSADWALASLAVLAGQGRVLTVEMLEAALAMKFDQKVLEKVFFVVKKALTATVSQGSPY